MRIILTLLLIFGCSYQHAAAASEIIPHVVSTSEYVKFYFPLAHQDQYSWYKETTIENNLEYSFAIKTGALEAGFYLYKYPGSKNKKGNLSELLSNGQKSVWVSDNKSEITSVHHSVDLFYSNPYFVISVTNPETLKLIQSNSEALFFIRGFNVESTQLKVVLP